MDFNTLKYFKPAIDLNIFVFLSKGDGCNVESVEVGEWMQGDQLRIWPIMVWVRNDR